MGVDIIKSARHVDTSVRTYNSESRVQSFQLTIIDFAIGQYRLVAASLSTNMH